MKYLRQRSRSATLAEGPPDFDMLAAFLSGLAEVAYGSEEEIRDCVSRNERGSDLGGIEQVRHREPRRKLVAGASGYNRSTVGDDFYNRHAHWSI